MKDQLVTGIISTTQKGAGYIDDIDPKADSIYIEAGTLNTALNGDTVEVVVNDKFIRGLKQRVGVVKKIISRAKDTFVGIVTQENNVWYVLPDDKKMYVKIVLSTIEAVKVKKDQKVQVKIDEWKNAHSFPTAT
ncbi:MAG: hypothetical protein M3Q80_02110, partial [bacterium]|nr:hypothetical protein [bacterium]